MRLPGLIAAWTAACLPLLVQAHIYGYIDERGTAHFAAEKLDARYQLFLQGGSLTSAESAGTPASPARPALLRYLSQHPNLRKFEPLVLKASNDFDLDPALLKAVMAAESAFRPDAVSPKGAIGLMQVMPATAARYGVQADQKRTIEEKLVDPELNIRVGARYLRDLRRKFANQQELVLASYNAGEGAVQQYGNQVPPYPETRNYVQLVSRFYQLYQPRATPSLPARATREITVNSVNGVKRLYLTIPGRRNVPAALAPASAD